VLVPRADEDGAGGVGVAGAVPGSEAGTFQWRFSDAHTPSVREYWQRSEAFGFSCRGSCQRGEGISCALKAEGGTAIVKKIIVRRENALEMHQGHHDAPRFNANRTSAVY